MQDEELAIPHRTVEDLKTKTTFSSIRLTMRDSTNKSDGSALGITIGIELL